MHFLVKLIIESTPNSVNKLWEPEMIVTKYEQEEN